MKLTLQTAASAMNATYSGPDSPVTGWSVDSRTVQPGEVYFALSGPMHDGHDFVTAALDRGAAAAVVRREYGGAGNLLRVENTLAALQRLAAKSRQDWGGRIVAVTGSAGKTTTKDAIAHLLATHFQTGKTAGNFNNHVGLPLSILRLPDESEVAVLEIGMNHAGEIRALARIASPEVAVVTNVGYAHIEFFDSIEGIALAKRELIEELPENGTAVLNADDPRVARFADSHPNVVTYGLSENADVRAENVELTSGGARFRCRGVQFESPLAGNHGVSNVLAALAVAKVFGLSLTRLREAVRTLATGRMRGERSVHGGITILNDCYNSNPEAAKSMIDVLAATAGARRIAVLGEMLELGHASEQLHHEVGQYARDRGIDVLIGIRGHAREMNGDFFDEPEAAGDYLREIAREGDAVLFKGSRGVQVERAMNRMLEGKD